MPPLPPAAHPLTLAAAQLHLHQLRPTDFPTLADSLLSQGLCSDNLIDLYYATPIDHDQNRIIPTFHRACADFGVTPPTDDYAAARIIVTDILHRFLARTISPREAVLQIFCLLCFRAFACEGPHATAEAIGVTDFYFLHYQYDEIEEHTAGDYPRGEPEATEVAQWLSYLPGLDAEVLERAEQWLKSNRTD